MEGSVQGQLFGSEIHGFHTLQDLDIHNIMDEAPGRWLRPNEIHAILCNYKYFSINVKPVNLPKSGTIILFDRKMLRNFRKDGYNWKKKKDGKTVKEAHEHLKVGNEERIHVYYAHGQDNQTFVRRCYWRLDKAYEHIVLVHYRETQESTAMLPSQKILFLSLTTALLFTIFMASSAHSAPVVEAHPAVAVKEVHPDVEKKQPTWQKQPWMIHGSDRGPRKHLINPVVDCPFEVPKLPV